MSDADHKPPSLPNLEVLRLIGEGSYGQVWLARTVLRSYVAVKLVERARFEDQRHYEREFQSACKYEQVSRGDPSQLRLLAAGRDEAAGFFYYTMELADDLHRGRAIDPETYVPATLKAYLDGSGRLAVEECIRTGLALSSALQHLHSKGLVHRDIKPSNIVFVEGLPKLADIGLVTTAGEARSFVGTTDYIAPEGPGCASADVYALGKTLYRMVTGLEAGRYPDLPPDFEKLPDLEVRQELMAVCLKACARTLAERHESAAALNAELALLRAGKSVRRQRSQEKFVRMFRRMVLLAIFVGLFPASIVATAWWWWSAQREILLREAQESRVSGQLGWTDKSSTRLAKAAWPIPTEAQYKERATLLSALDYRIIAGTNEGWLGVAAYSLVFDETGRHLLIGGHTNAPTRVWHRDTGRLEVLSASGHGPVAWDRTGEPLQLSLRDDGAIVLRELRAGRDLRELRFATPPLSKPDTSITLALSPGGEYAAAGWHHPSGRGGWSAWRMATGELLASENGLVTALTFEPDSASLALGFSDGAISVRSLPSMTETTRFRAGRAGIYSLAFGRAGQAGSTNEASSIRRLAAGDARGGIYVCDLNSGQTEPLRGSRYHVYALAFSSDGSMLVSAGRDQVRWWDAATGERILSFRGTTVGTDNAHALAFSGDGRLLAIGTDRLSQAGGATVIETKDALPIRTLRGLPDGGTRVWFSPDSRWLAALSQDWSLGVFDLKDGRLALRLEAPNGEFADNAGVAFDLAASRIAASAGNEARLWDMKSGQLITNWTLPWGYSDKMTVTQDGRLLSLRREDDPGGRPFKTWRVRQFEPGKAPIDGVRQEDFSYRPIDHEFGPEGRFFTLKGKMNATQGGTFRVYDTTTGRLLWHTNFHARESGMTLTPDGAWAVLELLDVRDRALVSLPEGRIQKALPMLGHRLSPDRRWLAWASNEGCQFAEVDDLSDPVTLGIGFGAAGIPEFSPDGKLLAWATGSGAVLVADLDDVKRQTRASP